MPVFDAYGERKVKQVMNETWGHLKPLNGVWYYGTVVFACGFDGTVALLSMDFATKDCVPLEGNPWSHEVIERYIVDWVCDQANHFRKGRAIPKNLWIETDGNVYRFTGHYIRYDKTDSYRIIDTSWVKLTIS